MNAQQTRIRVLLNRARSIATSSREVPVDILTELASEGYLLSALDDDLNS